MTQTIRFSIALLGLVICGAPLSHAQEQLATGPASARVIDIHDPNQVHQVIDNFQERLVDLGSNRTITACDPLIYYYGPVTNTARRGSSFGGVCSIVNKGQVRRVLMCNDYMIGNFTLGESGGMNKNDLVRFTRDNCRPGG